MVNISTVCHTGQMNQNAFERSGIGLSLWSDEPLSPRVPFFKVFVFFLRYSSDADARNNSIFFYFVEQGLAVKGFRVAYFYGFRTFEKIGFY